jgi:hypothetical protein
VKARLIAPAVLILALPVQSATIHVPGDQPTIQAGINATAAGDTMLADCGTYFERNVTVKSRLVLRSATGCPDCVTIDGETVDRIMLGVDLSEDTILEGLTFTGGSELGFNVRGGVIALRAASRVS